MTYDPSPSPFIYEREETNCLNYFPIPNFPPIPPTIPFTTLPTNPKPPDTFDDFELPPPPPDPPEADPPSDDLGCSSPVTTSQDSSLPGAGGVAESERAWEGRGVVRRTGEEIGEEVGEDSADEEEEEEEA